MNGGTMRKWLKHRGALAAAAVVAILLVIALRPTAIEVELARVSRGAMRVTVDDEGMTRIRDKFLMTAPVAGALSRIEREPGDRVARGDVFATIRPERPPLLDARTRAELSARVEAARAAVSAARADEQRAAAGLAHAQAELRRVRPLNKAGAISDSELDTYETQARSADEAHRAALAAVARAASELEAVRAALVDDAGFSGVGTNGKRSAEGTAQGSGVEARPGRAVFLRIPIDGVVLRRLRESESVVPAGEGLLEVGDPQRLEVVADFLSTDAVRIQAGAAVIVDQWGGGRSLVGRVRRVEPSGFTKVSALGVEEQRVNVIVDFTDPVEAWQALGDGFRVEVRVVLWEAGNVLKAPVGSLFRQGEAWAVYVERDGRAERRTVTMVHRNDREAEVTEGLREGERVVMHPSDALTPGSRVRARDVP
jgi:HlyD family secretion protein